MHARPGATRVLLVNGPRAAEGFVSRDIVARRTLADFEDEAQALLSRPV